MRIFVQIVQLIACVGLIVTVLLQSGSSAGLGSISGGAETLFGGNKKGLDELLAKVSVVCAAGFMLLTLLLCIL